MQRDKNPTLMEQGMSTRQSTSQNKFMHWSMLRVVEGSGTEMGDISRDAVREGSQEMFCKG